MNLLACVLAAVRISRHHQPITKPEGYMGKRVACKNCRFIGSSELPPRKGSVLITLILLFCGILPGIIYMIWRRTGERKERCPKCKSENIGPVGSFSMSKPDHSNPSFKTHSKCPACQEWVMKEASKCKHCGSALVPVALP